MDRDELLDCCLSKVGAEEDYPFGDDLAVIKVGSKTFTLVPPGGRAATGEARSVRRSPQRGAPRGRPAPESPERIELRTEGGLDRADRAIGYQYLHHAYDHDVHVSTVGGNEERLHALRNALPWRWMHPLLLEMLPDLFGHPYAPAVLHEFLAAEP